MSSSAAMRLASMFARRRESVGVGGHLVTLGYETEAKPRGSFALLH